MKSMKKILMLLIVFSIVLTSSGLTVLAEENDYTENISDEMGEDETDLSLPESNIQNESGSESETDDLQGENVSESITTDEINNGSESKTTDENEPELEEDGQDVIEKQKAFEYIYVDQEVVNIPEDQNIAIIFSDAELLLESAVLYYSSVEDGTVYEAPASNIVENMVLFTISYTDEESAGTYNLESISYKISRQTEEINVSFEEQDIFAGYTVTTEAESAASGERSEETAEVAVYSMDNAGNTVEQTGDNSSIEATVEAVLEETSLTPQAFSLARAVTRANHKVIVICAGHDATHAGATANGLREEQLTYKVAQYCKVELEKYSNVTVYLDRESIDCAYPGQSSSYCLNQRVKDAAAKGATVFVDLHFNIGGGRGAEIYYPNNTAIHKDGENIANQIIAQLTALGLTNRGTMVKDCTTNDYDSNGNLDDYFTTNYLSKQYGMTGIIVEHAFLDNSSDAAKLKQESFLKQLGVADATGIAKAYNLTQGTGSTEIQAPIINYSAHVQDIGWQSYVNNGTTAGTTGRNLQVEALRIQLLNTAYDGSVTYSAHVQDIGWQNFVSNGAVSGTTGKNKQVEAVKINLTGTMSEKYDIYYRVHSSDFGWLGWAKNGAAAGSAGYAKQVEALQICLVEKGGAAPGSTANAYKEKTTSTGNTSSGSNTDSSTTTKTIGLKYSAHVENIGWMSYANMGSTAGTTGRNLQLEALKLTLTEKPYSGSIQYCAHVQDIGWQSFVSEGSISGTTGKNKAVEAVKIKLTGELANQYDIYYRVHSSDFGWLGWAKNGAAAGSEGFARQVEAIEIKIVKKESAAPGSATNCFYKK